ncbi:bifunctional Ribonuclease H superfamily/Ribonuclease CAF1/Ribonuclease H-like superfamily [Babesia duncani]|uniref:Bifunctional Ribonuclease H superfamily/Ribonuclease CAF1/Ribonuclease H-like superfamily n=1 Tax=Babesia duncani TaxID=323732 RepID=A0AAD9PNN3_9APIC|nr:bifunctional Ribonuclease H superfamily/Ribonuclease CAF1/Ribonuclease H-like superfamily [Babesia duncani]
MNDESSPLAEIIERIPQCTFISIDTEFGGISDRSKSIKELEEYFLAVKEDVEDYTIFQIGICLCFYSTDADIKWTLDPYKFYTFSTEIPDSCLLNSTASWLRKNGFSFDRWVSEGLPYRRLADINDRTLEKKRKRKEYNEIHMIIDAIILNKKPVIVHYGFFDLMHIYDKFIGLLPDTQKEMASELQRLFVGNIYDTKYIAKYLFQYCDVTMFMQTSLSNLVTAVLNENNLPKCFEIKQEKKSFGYFDEEKRILNESLFHDAGFDATVTAMVFVGQCELLMNIDKIAIPDIFKNHADMDSSKHISKLVNRLRMPDIVNEGVYDLTVHGKD